MNEKKKSLYTFCIASMIIIQIWLKINNITIAAFV